MALVAIVWSTLSGEASAGFSLCAGDSSLLLKVLKYSFCSAVGQAFVFFTIANFGPLTLATVTTSRKVFSVLLSIFLKGHALSGTGKFGLILACTGIFLELKKELNKSNKPPHDHKS